MSRRTDPRKSGAMKRVPSVRDLMVRDFVAVGPDATMGDVARTLMRRRAREAAVIDEDGRFLGFLSARGVLAALAEFLHDERPVGPILGYLEPHPPRLAEDSSLLAALHLFGQLKSGAPLPVLRGLELVGVVNPLDVVRAVMEYLGGGKDTAPGTLYISALDATGRGRPY